MVDQWDMFSRHDEVFLPINWEVLKEVKVEPHPMSGVDTTAPLELSRVLHRREVEEKESKVHHSILEKRHEIK